MCGIIGLFTYKFDNSSIDLRVKSIIQRMLFTESLVAMEPRGKDATGIALLWDDNQVAVVKQPMPVSHFAKEDGTWGEDYTNPVDKEAHFKWLMDTWMRKHPDVQLKQALGHVRASTKGAESNPHNNHPIIISDRFTEDKGKVNKIKGKTIIGVHNGGIRNDDELEKKYHFGRVGQVDSEVIFQLIHQKNNVDEDTLAGVFKELQGTYTILAFDPENPNKVMGMRETRPLNAGYIKELGTLILISESKYLNAALEEYERWRIREGNQIYSYIDEQGAVQSLGKIYDVFPYLSVKWYNEALTDTMEEGVFVLDLNTEVSKATVPSDLVKVKKVIVPAVGNAHIYMSKDGRAVRSGAIPVTEEPAKGAEVNKVVASTTVSTPQTTVVSRENKNTIVVEGAEIVDSTDYTKTLPTTEEKDEVGKEDTIELTMDALEGDDDRECPYSWEERHDVGSTMLFGAELDVDEHIILTNNTPQENHELLQRYLIDTKSPEESTRILTCLYEVIFPEGVAVGFKEGYTTALDDSDSISEGEELLDKNKIDELKKDIVVKDAIIKNLKDSIAKLSVKKTEAQKYIANIRPTLYYLLQERGVLDAQGSIIKEKLEAFNKETGLSPNIVKKINKTKG